MRPCQGRDRGPTPLDRIIIVRNRRGFDYRWPHMNKSLEEIIKTSTFTIKPGRFVYAKVKSAPSINGHFLITQDPDEITVVTLEETSLN